MESVKWRKKELEDTGRCESLRKGLGVHALTARLLSLRGVQDVDVAEKFLSPSLRDLPHPTVMKGVDKACERIANAILSNERIVIYGDYDVDGVTSTSLLTLFFRSIGVPEERVNFFIPNRVLHGYGLRPACIPLVEELGCDLMITVDCGITSVDEVRLAKERGIETIIIDHHLTPPDLPDAFAILNPHQPGCQYPDKGLAAVGVTFNLVMALRAHLRQRGYFNERPEPNLKQFLDIVALGTVADVVPVGGVNRIFVRIGLQQMKRTQWLGLDSLLRTARVNVERLAAGTLGYQLGPRINAAGRLRDAAIGVKLLTTENPSEAYRLSEELDQENRKRREIEKHIHNEARNMLQQSEKMLAEPAIVLSHEGWHPGVIGIVASRLVEEFHRPTVVIAMEKGVGKGSARSIRGFHLHQGFTACQAHLEQFGGHAMAAGLTIHVDEIVPFRRAFMEHARQVLTPDDLCPTLEFDAEFSPSDLSDMLLEEIEELEPYGISNPAPLLVGHKVPVVQQKLVGAEGKHLSLRVGVSAQRSLKAIAFGQHNVYPLPHEITLAYRPQFDYWQGKRSIQLQIKKIYPIEEITESPMF